MVVLAAFVGASQAYLTAGPAKMLCQFAVPGHCVRGEAAHGRAIDIKRDAAGHHLDIVFLKAGRHAHIAGSSARVAGVNAGLVLICRIHLRLLVVDWGAFSMDSSFKGAL